MLSWGSAERIWCTYERRRARVNLPLTRQRPYQPVRITHPVRLLLECESKDITVSPSLATLHRCSAIVDFRVL
jgi:hypothetical protein